MNIIDKLYTRIIIPVVIIKTSIDSYTVIERIENAVESIKIEPQVSDYFSYRAEYDGNYFSIQSRLHKPDGSDEFPTRKYISIGPFHIPVYVESSPTFYASVFDDEKGSVIWGHFGFPIHVLLAVLAIGFIFLGVVYPFWSKATSLMFALLIIASIRSLYQSILERKGIKEFLKKLLADVIR
jgi:hypothetical protein